MSIFAASQTKRFLHSPSCGSYFYGYTDAALSKDIRLSIHNGLPHACCNFSWSRCGEIAFLHLRYFDFSYMTKRMKDCSIAKHSTNTATLSHETGTFSPALNLQEITRVLIEVCEHLHEKTEMKIYFIINSTVVGNNISGDGNDVVSGNDNANTRMEGGLL
jgi:hypothetical protein